MGPRRLTVRGSTIHGRGVFAAARIPAGEELLRYAGELIEWPEATRRYQLSEVESGHTLYFDVGDGYVIDGAVGGNSARWINHGCEPNCEAVVIDRQVRISAVRDIAPGDELLLDYQLQIDPDADEGERALYTCRCGAQACRATMLEV